jgi:ParB family chromosome partitioning protein
VTETLSLSRLPPRVKDECRRADIHSKSFLLEVGRLPSEPAMLDAIASFSGGEGVGRDSVRTARRGGDAAEASRFRSYRKAYELNFQPPDAPYAVSLVFRGNGADRSEILRTLRDVIRKIEAGEVSLEEHGRFLKAGPTRSGNDTPTDPSDS